MVQLETKTGYEEVVVGHSGVLCPARLPVSGLKQ